MELVVCWNYKDGLPVEVERELRTQPWRIAYRDSTIPKSEVIVTYNLPTFVSISSINVAPTLFW